MWEEVWENGDPLASDTIVDVWKDWEGWADQLAEVINSLVQSQQFN